MKLFVWVVMNLLVAPIWYFLLYTLLSAAHVDRLVWFLFWVYVPFSFLIRVLEKAIQSKEN